MKFFWSLVFVAITVSAALGVDREAFSIPEYKLDTRVEPEQQRLAVRGKIVARNDSTLPQRILVLQISSSLNWSSIQVDGKPAQVVKQGYASDIDHTGALSEAIITLPRDVAVGKTVEVEIGYEGVVPLDATRLTRIGVPEEVAKNSDWDQISPLTTAVRGIGHVVWYPVATEAASLSDANTVFETVGRWQKRERSANMEVDFCLDQSEPGQSKLVLTSGRSTGGGVGSGTERLLGENPGPKTLGCTHSVFRDLDEDVPVFAVGDYATLTRPSVDIYYLGDDRGAAEDYALATELAVPFVTDWFGAPRGRVQVIEVPEPASSPFESGTTLLTPFAAKPDSRQTQLTAVHQVTHAALESPRWWIEEGSAHFEQAVFRESQSGRQAALDFMETHRAAVVDVEKSLASEQNAATEQSLVNTSLPELYRSKAMYVWWMLRDMVGDAPLKRALARYKAEEDKDPSYIQRLIQNEAKQELGWFFDDWVYRDRGLPDLRVESVFPRKLLDKGYVVTITVENLGSAGAEVPVTMKIEGGEVTKRVIVPGKGKSVIRLESATKPQQVVVNDGSVPESDVTNNSFTVGDAR